MKRIKKDMPQIFIYLSSITEKGGRGPCPALATQAHRGPVGGDGGPPDPGQPLHRALHGVPCAAVGSVGSTGHAYAA